MNRAGGILSSRGARRRLPPSARAGVARWLSISSPAADDEATNARRRIRDDGLGLADFVRAAQVSGDDAHSSDRRPSEPRSGPPPSPSDIGDEFDDDALITDAMSSISSGGGGEDAAARLGRRLVGSEDDDLDIDAEGAGLRRHHTLKFHLKTYGCQMNVNDTDIVRSILLDNHKETSREHGGASGGDGPPPLRFEEVADEVQADVLLTNTCAIRDNAERKVWQRLHTLRAHDRNFPLDGDDGTKGDGLMGRTKEARKQAQAGRRGGRKRIIGVLGCMAERLKEDMFEQGTADVVVGPDAYRDLPRLISVLAAPSLPNRDGDSGTQGAPSIPTERAVNVQLSLDETYASITPVRANPDDVSAFVSVMRGCNNMCSYCVVPFTRGRERSRDLESVVGETRRLLDEEGIREVILLGQNVNSYHDGRGGRSRNVSNGDGGTYRTSNDGFSNVFRARHGGGHRFADLLEAVSSLSPELRVRFTSPHPKDYPPELLGLMAERPNVCSHLHMPAQSGSSAVLERMRRGYTREAYLDLIADARSAIPGVSISSDFIAGFCGETEAEHLETLSLMEEVRYDQAFMFAYSMRGRTHAHRTMADDVPEDVKARRLSEVIDVFRRNVQARNEEVEVGTARLVLVEGESKRSTPRDRVWSGRTDGNKRVVFDDAAVPTEEDALAAAAAGAGLPDPGAGTAPGVRIGRGDYVAVRVTEARGHTLKADALCRSSVAGFEKLAAAERELEERRLPLDVAL